MILGRSGTGKTTHCLCAIVRAMSEDPLGPPILWLLPRQATFTAERELTVAWGLPGYARTRVVSFHELSRIVLSECGGDALPLISDIGRQMIIGHLLRQHVSELRHFQPAARRVGLAAELESTFSELERCGKDVADLDALLHHLEAHDPSSPLVAKVADLRLLYDAYLRHLGQERLDPHRRLRHMLEKIEGCNLIRESTIYVDDFLEFSELERRIVVTLAKTCRRMEITLLLDPHNPVVDDPRRVPDELSLFFRTENHYRRLLQALQQHQVKVEPPLKLLTPYRFSNPVLSRIDRHFALPHPPSIPHPTGVMFIETCDRRAEVEAAARQVWQWVQQGLRLRDILILTRDLDEYHSLIEACFLEHDIAFFLDRRRPASHHPLIRLVRAVVQLLVHDWPHDAMMTLIKTRLAGLSPDEADELENYVLLHRIRGSAWDDPNPWSFHRQITLSEDQENAPQRVRRELMRINAIRDRLMGPLRLFVREARESEPPTVRRLATSLFGLLETLQVRQRLVRWMQQAAEDNRLEEQAEHEQVWRELVELIEQMVDLLGDTCVTPGQFAEILDVGLERFDLAITPPTVDQVLVGSLDRTRGGNPRAVILLGMNDGQFPRAPGPNAILSDSDRDAIAEVGTDLESNSVRRLLDENLLGYIAFTRPSEYLCLIRACADESNRPQPPSLFWRKLRQMLPEAPVESVPRDPVSDARFIHTPRQLVTTLMGWVHSSREDSPVPCHVPPLYQWFAQLPQGNDPVTVLRRKAWGALSYTNQARLTDEVAGGLFKSPLRCSVSRLETFAACPFRHFARYGLRLEPREDPDVTAIDLGNLYHGVLDQVVKSIIAEKADLTALDHEKIHRLIARVSDQLGRELRGELMISSARNQYLLQRIRKTVEQVVAAQEAMARRSTLRPRWTELSFGLRDAVLPALRLITPAGRVVDLHGKIDRVDLIEQESAFAVLDYKLHGDKLSLTSVYHGLSLQLLTYLLVLQAQSTSLFGKPLTPAAAFYVKLLRKLEQVADSRKAPDPSDPSFHLKHKPRGVFDARFLHHLDHELVPGGKSEVVQASIKLDGQLGNAGQSDALPSHEFCALLEHVKRCIVELADRILQGEIAVWPYMMGRITPCPRCEYRSVCRFEVPVNRYRVLESPPKAQVLSHILVEVADDP